MQKQRHYFASIGPSNKAMVFPVVMYGCESWTVKKAEHWWIDAFEPWCWRRFLSVPWTARRSSQSILKEISSEYSLEELMFWPPDAKNWLIWKDPDAGKDWRWKEKGFSDRGCDGWMASPIQWTWVSVNSESWWWTGRPSVLWFIGSQRVGHDWTTELTELIFDVTISQTFCVMKILIVLGILVR